LALYYHKQALELRQAIPTTASIDITSSFIGIANAHRALHEYSEAIANAERALALQEALVPPNEKSVAITLALLSNMYQDSGDTAHALDLCTKALVLFERSVSASSPLLAELLCNLGTIQASTGELSEAQRNLERSVMIYRRLLFREHPDRVSAENELRRIIQLRQKNE
jgi:tetratricopeptide (TPR) repeat protein